MNLRCAKNETGNITRTHSFLFCFGDLVDFHNGLKEIAVAEYRITELCLIVVVSGY